MDASGNGIVPFAIENGVVKILNARIAGANIDDLFVKGNQIEPAANGFIKAFSLASTGGGTYDFVVTHGINQVGTHHEMRFDFGYSLSRGGTGSTQGLGAYVQNLSTGDVVFNDAHVVSAGQTLTFSKFKYYSIPSSTVSTSTTFRIEFSSSPNVSWSNIQLGAVITKNVPNNI